MYRLLILRLPWLIDGQLEFHMCIIMFSLRALLTNYYLKVHNIMYVTITTRHTDKQSLHKQTIQLRTRVA